MVEIKLINCLKMRYCQIKIRKTVVLCSKKVFPEQPPFRKILTEIYSKFLLTKEPRNNYETF